MSTSILECKLKRHKISYSNENGKIIIGKPKIDYGTLIGLIAFSDYCWNWNFFINDSEQY